MRLRDEGHVSAHEGDEALGDGEANARATVQAGSAALSLGGRGEERGEREGRE